VFKIYKVIESRDMVEEKARDRNIWGRIIKEAKVHKGL
jgi:hypothetical protein